MVVLLLYLSDGRGDLVTVHNLREVFFRNIRMLIINAAGAV
jgi:hypothetical protein